MPADTAKALGTRKSIWTKVFRAIVAKLKVNSELGTILGADRIFSWDGRDGSNDPLADSNTSPYLRLTPRPTGVSWHDPSAHSGTLVVDVEMTVYSICIDDVIDLWDLLVSALRPGDANFSKVLSDLGAETGEIVFSDPAIASKPGSPQDFFDAAGSFSLTVVRSIES